MAARTKKKKQGRCPFYGRPEYPRETVVRVLRRPAEQRRPWLYLENFIQMQQRESAVVRKERYLILEKTSNKPRSPAMEERKKTGKPPTLWRQDG